MEQIPVRELNQHTSAVLRRVAQGEILEVTVNGKPVVRLVPVGDQPALLDRLIAEGRATPATLRRPFPKPKVYGDPGINVAEELAAMREDERW
ncbi:type II toxin-antitoxin system Phd/YefM family antitoxin [Actinopolymorpha alba]|uniref:type II toxin-antitoxin system Phd/YefM family antitoxin n=1 Tax=Actinopolymorpha alba TaxID=533267 RepID=UPI0003768CE0|nr:type II toxin-antitoxin system prevent-host-death family antitoxin [Actinopolymorpha alba]